MKNEKTRISTIAIMMAGLTMAMTCAKSDAGFGTITVDPAFELDGSGKNVDSLAFWEAPDPSETLLFVTAKDNNLVEVWKYPFQGHEYPPNEFSSTVKGVAVDQEMDWLYVTESGSKKVNILSLPSLERLGDLGQGDFGEGETNLAILKGINNQTLVYVTDDHKVHWFDAASGTHLGAFSPNVSSIETILADDFFRIIMVPEEQGPQGHPGVYAFYPDGRPFEKEGTNRFGNDSEFEADEEGILLYTFPASGMGDNGGGFIVVAEQANDQTDFEFFDRITWRHLGTLRIDGVSNSDGIASTQKALPDYPLGLFIAINDDRSTVGVGWDRIFEDMGPFLSIHRRSQK